MDNSAVQNKLDTARANLAKAQEAYDRTLHAQSWQTQNGIDRRSVTNVSLETLSREVDKWQARVDKYERMLNGGSVGACRIGVKL